MVISKKPKYKDWMAKELYIVNQSLKYNRSDGKVSTKLEEGRLKYLIWKDRPEPNYDNDITELRKRVYCIGDSEKEDKEVCHGEYSNLGQYSVPI